MAEQQHPQINISLTDYITNNDIKDFFLKGNQGNLDFGELGKIGAFEFPNFFTKEQCDELFQKLEDARDPSIPKWDPRSEFGWPVTPALEDGGKFLHFIREGVSHIFGDAIASQLTRIYAFVLSYDKEGEPTQAMNVAMAPHKDDCLITFNVCLWSEPENTAELIFHGQHPSLLFPKKARSNKANDIRTSLMHNTGKAVLHRGVQVHEVKHHDGNRRRNLVVYLLADEIDHLLNRVILST
eukprot:EG_transcript_13656